MYIKCIVIQIRVIRMLTLIRTDKKQQERTKLARQKQWKTNEFAIYDSSTKKYQSKTTFELDKFLRKCPSNTTLVSENLKQVANSIDSTGLDITKYNCTVVDSGKITTKKSKSTF